MIPEAIGGGAGTHSAARAITPKLEKWRSHWFGSPGDRVAELRQL